MNTTFGRTAPRRAPGSTLIAASLAALLCSAVNTTRADVLELKGRAILSGAYVGGTAETVRFESQNEIRVYPKSDLVALTFTSAGASAAASTLSSSPSTATIPAGTTLLVRMAEPLTSQNKAGSIFTAKLAYDLMAEGARVAPAGSVVLGKVQGSTQAGRIAGRSSLEIRLYQLSIGGQPVAITTDSYREAGANSAGRLARSAGAGAAIGEIASNDAGRGAALGAGIATLRRGQMTTIPAGALLEFSLTQPVTFRIQK